LLLSQFGIALYYQYASTAGLSWTRVNVSVGLLTVTSYFYSQSIQDKRRYFIPDGFLSESSWRYFPAMSSIIILPEITMDVAWALIFFGYIQTAFLSILTAMMVFAVAVACISVRMLNLKSEEQESTNDEAGDEMDAKSIDNRSYFTKVYEYSTNDERCR
jgi:mannose/fructose/N-acetylgalactosamine-specific phosphotransferase system component IIC